MSDEAKLAREQGGAGCAVIGQQERAENRTSTGHRKGEPQPRALSERGQILDIQVHRVALALDQPAAHVVEIGGR